MERRGWGLGDGYRWLWRAGALSNLGDGVYLGALPVLAAGLASRPSEVALVTAAAWVPWLLVGVVSGALADRWDRLRLMVGADAVRCVALVLLAAAVLSGTATIGLLVVVAFVLGVGQTLFDSAAQAVLPVVVGRDEARLARATARLAGAQTAGKELAGPPVGSGLYALVPALPFVLDAVSFLASALLLRRLRRTGRVPPPPRTGTATSLGRDVLAGWRWLAGRPVVAAMAVVVGLGNLAWVGCESVLVLFATDRLGVAGSWYGVLVAAPGVGAIPGAALASRLTGRLPAGAVLVGGPALQGAVLLGVGRATSPYLVVPLLALGGLLIAVWNVHQSVHRQLLVPDRVTGRVVASMRVVAYGSAPVGAAAAGFTADRYGTAVPFVLAAGVLLVATVVAAPCLNGRALARARALAEPPG